MAMNQIVDLDSIITEWATQRMGSDYAIDKVDISKLKVSQRSVMYQSSNDWWQNVTSHEEFFDNQDGQMSSWDFQQDIDFKSTASWSLIKGFKSTKVLPTNITLEYPVSADGQEPLKVVFDTSQLDGQVRKTTDCKSNWTVKEEVEVKPYSSVRTCAQVRCCKLQNVMFTTDLCLSGTLKVVGHKKNRKWSKHEASVSIADALGYREAQGFLVVDNTTNPNAPARQVVCRFEGVCSGEVGISPLVSKTEISSLV